MSRGLELPRRGSPRDLVLRELLGREQAARASETGLIVRLLSAQVGVPRERVDVALELHIRELTQARYAPGGEAMSAALLEKAKNSATGTETADEMRERLRRVAALNSPR